MSEFPVELKRRRLEMGLGQAELAEALGVATKTVGRWEQGSRWPQAAQASRICQFFGDVSRVQMGLEQAKAPDVHDVMCLLEGLDDMKRREFLSALVGAAAGLASGEWQLGPRLTDADRWDRLIATLQQSTRIDSETVAQLESATITLQELEPQQSPQALMGMALGHYNVLSDLIKQGRGDEAQKAELKSLAAETAAVLGWVFWDLDRLEEASTWFMSGLETARDVGDYALGAYLVGCRAVQPTFREKPDARLRQLDGRTFGFSARHGTPAIQAWLATLAADSHAMAGSPDRARRALERARNTMATPPSGLSPRPRWAFFDSACLAGEVGVCMARLASAPHVGRQQRGRLTTEGRGVLEQALTDLPPTRMKTRPRLLAALASTHVAEGEVEQACEVGTQILDLGAMTRDVQPNLQDVLRLRRQLEPWRAHASVRHLDDRLRATA